MASVKDMTRQDRDFAYRRGDELYGDQRARAGENRGRRIDYEGAMWDQYRPFLEGYGGYRPHEADQIIGKDRIARMGQLADESFYMGDAEGAGWLGNPDDRFKFYDPQTAGEEQTTSEGYQRGAVSQQRGDLYGAIDPAELGVSEGYGADAEAALAGGEGAVRGAIDYNRLRQDPEYAKRLRMSPEEQERIATEAGLAAQAGHTSRLDQAEREGRAAGMNPMGMATLRQRVERDAASAGADAVLRGRVAASEAAAGREKDIESSRQGAEQFYAGTRAGHEQSLAGRRLGQVNTGEGLRMGAARDVSDRRMTAATESGRQAIQGEKDINAQRRQVNQYYTGVGSQLATSAEQDKASRARSFAENNQQAKMYGNANQLNTAKYADTQLAGRTAGVADTRRGDEREARGFLGGMYGGYNQNEQNEYNRQGQTFATQTGAAQNATANAVRADQKPSWWQSLLGAAAGGVGAFYGAGGGKGGGAEGFPSGEPGEAVIGEAGPEMVVKAPAPKYGAQAGGWKGYAAKALEGYADGGIGGAIGSVARYATTKPAGDLDPAARQDALQQASASDGGVLGVIGADSSPGSSMGRPLMPYGKVTKAPLVESGPGGHSYALGGRVVTKPTKVQLEEDEAVVPLQNRTPKVRPSFAFGY